MRHAMGIDLDRCVGCKACVSACVEQWDSGPGAARAWVQAVETGTRGQDLALSFYPGLCMQCGDHPCTADCPTGATFVDPRTGVVVVDAQVCIGCGSCVPSCPYGARHVDAAKKVVEKCNLCAPHVARGEQPACVATCPAECRIFGDLDDPGSAIAAFARRPGTGTLATEQVDPKPRTLYAGDRQRQRILAAGFVKAPARSWLSRTWGRSLPLARDVVPAAVAGSILGGLVVNWKARADRVKREERGEAEPVAPSAPPPSLAQAAAAAERERLLFRHRRGMRFLHWFNALSWALLLFTGTALMSAPGFALFGTGFPRWASGLLGGAERVIRVHVLWGLLWAALIVPLFLLFKHGPRHVLEEVRVTRDDLRWMLMKPFAMIGLAPQPLPPQDKYNAGQKLFAVAVLVGTTFIVGSGLVMVLHLGSGDAVALAVLVHKLAIVLMLVGVGVHLTMAAVIADERPALRSMVTGRIDYRHAKHHSPKWVARLDSVPPSGTEKES
jgi:formate dehydrogenase gamma subunit